MSEDERPCPCGKGTCTNISEMDDWNRTRSRSRMNCERCESDLVLVVKQMIESPGVYFTSRRWVPRAAFDESERLKAEAKANRDDAERLAEERYLDTFMRLFEGKSKKAVHSILTRGGRGYPSLGTFYNHVAADGLDTYLRRWFVRDIDRALQLLNVADPEIERLQAESKALSEASEQALRA